VVVFSHQLLKLHVLTILKHISAILNLKKINIYIVFEVGLLNFFLKNERIVK